MIVVENTLFHQISLNYINLQLVHFVNDKDNHDAFTNHQEIITKTIKYATKDNKELKLNTLSIIYGLDDLIPLHKIIKLYYDFSRRSITFFSDSH